MTQLKKVTISEAVVLGNTGNLRLRFKELPQNIIAIRPLSVVLLSLPTIMKGIVENLPTNLVGATLTVEDNTTQDGELQKSALETFKKGEKYILTDVNSLVKNGDINPETNAPYKAGDTAECKEDGVRIQGRIILELHPVHKARITAKVEELSIMRTFQKQEELKALSMVMNSTSNPSDLPEVGEKEEHEGVSKI